MCREPEPATCCRAMERRASTCAVSAPSPASTAGPCATITRSATRSCGVPVLRMRGGEKALVVVARGRNSCSSSACSLSLSLSGRSGERRASSGSPRSTRRARSCSCRTRTREDVPVFIELETGPLLRFLQHFRTCQGILTNHDVFHMVVATIVSATRQTIAQPTNMTYRLFVVATLLALFLRVSSTTKDILVM
jgi:hypothetical protein